MTNERNPFAPPRASLDDGGMVRHNDVDREQQAMRALGQLRSRARGRAFAVSWALSALPLMLIMGLVPAMLAGAAIASAISTIYVKATKQAMVEKICQEFGLSVEAFAPDRYLID